MQHMKRRDIIMKMKKLLVLGLSAVMAAAMLTGCGGSDKKEEKSLMRFFKREFPLL